MRTDVNKVMDVLTDAAKSLDFVLEYQRTVGDFLAILKSIYDYRLSLYTLPLRIWGKKQKERQTNKKCKTIALLEPLKHAISPYNHC